MRSFFYDTKREEVLNIAEELTILCLLSKGFYLGLKSHFKVGISPVAEFRGKKKLQNRSFSVA